MYNDIFLVGLNHKTAGVDIRERFALTNLCSKELWAIPCTDIVHENIILSTCNRVEIIASGASTTPEELLRDWAEAREASIDELRPYVYIYENINAIRHLFSVASSLDSMVVGEPQILGQLKKAFKMAATAKKTGPTLNRLLHKAFSVAKRVRTETSVASSAVSISYAAVELAKRIFGDMHAYKAMLIGAGEMAELAAKHLLHFGIKQLYVANRTYAKAQSLAAEFNGEAVAFEQIAEYLPKADIVITSTGSTDPIIRAKNLNGVLRERKNRPMFFIDIAVPRDVDPDVNAIDNIYLYDIDDLKEIVDENISNRKDEAIKAQKIINDEVENYLHWFKSLELQPTIVKLIERNEKIAKAELEYTCKHLNLDENTKQSLEVMLSSILNKINHDPLMYLKGENTHIKSLDRINIIQSVFGLNKQSSTDDIREDEK
ncbi:MAG: glutamyl-tRNA reductase [Desulfovibrionaceae bacterium]|nr:glutamyl-tRNA reductase [Desulfovibrionaceae bacterium]